MDCTLDLGLNVRLSLSGVGQIASPLQAAWVLSFLVSKLSILRSGSCQFPPESQIVAFRSWLLMKCFSMWPCNDEVVHDRQLCALVDFWKDYKEVPITQLLHASHWPDLKGDMSSIAAVLDSIICSSLPVAPSVPAGIDAPETPWYDQPIADPKCDLCLNVAVSIGTLIDTDGSSVQFGFQAGSTISDVLQAHARLIGPLAVQLISDDRGHFLPFTHPIDQGQCIQVFLSKSDEGELFSGDDPPSHPVTDVNKTVLPDNDMEASCPTDTNMLEPFRSAVDGVSGESGPLPKLPDVFSVPATAKDLMIDHSKGEISPTAAWTFPCKEELNIEYPGSETTMMPSLWRSVQALFGLTQQQFLRLSVPCIGDTGKLLSLRSQVITPNERIQLLNSQHDLFADDEIAFHLKQLVDQFCVLPTVVASGKAQVCVIDPLLMSAWICGCGYPIDVWAKCHAEVLQSGIQVIGVGRLEMHWIPFQFVPCGTHANVFTWDAPCHGHERFNQVLEHIGKALGFNSVLINRQQRLFPVSLKCGAMAIHFLHGALHGTMLPIVASEVDMVHSMLRKRFLAGLSQVGTALRPWIWGSGDADDELPQPLETEGECGLLPRLPTRSEPVRAAIESLTRETRSNVTAFVQFSPDDVVPFEPSSSSQDDQVRGELEAVTSDSVLLQQLVLIDCQRMRGLEVPVIDSLHRLGWLRSQLISVPDRLAMLVRQFGIWADDELRFHLHELAATCAAQGMLDGDFQRPMVIDPLHFSSWFDERSLSCVQWAKSQPDVWINQTKLIGVFKWDNHWFPVLFIPEGDHVTISLSHRHLQIPARLVNMFVDMATELGFGGIRFHHEMPNFVCYSACGASAIDFLRHRLLGCPIATTYAQVWGQHAQFREFFRQTLLNETMVSRPWVWASGEGDDEDTEKEWISDEDEAKCSGLGSNAEVPGGVPLPTVPSQSHTCIDLDARIELFAQHSKAMGDDEIRFHLSTLLKQRGARIMAGREVIPIVLGFESLNFMNWDEVGHILTEKWCQGFPQVKDKGHQIVAVVLEGTHWLPLWFVPGGMVLVIHTFDDIVDYDIFDGKLRWMGLHLGFEEVVIHRVPHGLPSHDMCGAHALAFLAHVLLQAELPTDLAELDAMRVNMRASFVQAMYEGTTCFCPIVWGSGGTGALVKSLSEELCLHGVPEALSEQRASQAIKAIGSEQLQQALQQKQVWRHLKALASNVSFKLVLPAELDACIARNKGKTVGKKSGKVQRTPGFPLPVELDPSRLVVLEGTFRCQQQVLPQLTMQQIGPLSSGVVLMTPQEAEPYLKAGVLVSQEPLALVVFHLIVQTSSCNPCLPKAELRCLADAWLIMNQFWPKLHWSKLVPKRLRSLLGMTWFHWILLMSAPLESLSFEMRLKIGTCLSSPQSGMLLRSSQNSKDVWTLDAHAMPGIILKIFPSVSRFWIFGKDNLCVLDSNQLKRPKLTCSVSPFVCQLVCWNAFWIAVAVQVRT